MSHELTQHADGTVEMAYRLDHGMPWHGLGQPINPEEYHNLDAWIQQARMGWEAGRSRVRFGEAPNQRIYEGAHVLYRKDTKAPLGIVSPTYKIVQPRDLLEVFRGVLREGGLEMSAAGTLFGGKRFWCTARIGEASPVSVRDRVGAFLLGTSSLDGSLKTSFRRCATRAVCNNTVRMAFAEGPAELTISHRSHFVADDVRDFMKLNTAAWDAFRHNMVQLANKPVHEEEAAIVVQGLFQTGAKDADKVRESHGYKTVLSLFNGEGKGSDLDGVRDTAWGLLNAVTEYADHHVRAHSEENRLVSAQWGAGATLKSRAMEALLAL